MIAFGRDALCRRVSSFSRPTTKVVFKPPLQATYADSRAGSFHESRHEYPWEGA